MIWTPEREAHLRRMWVVEKMSITRIAAVFEVSRSVVGGKLYRLGLMGDRKPRKYRPYTDFRSPFATNSGDWDIKVREPYVAFKARRRQERETARVAAE